jgi:hypothetical protein
MVPLEPLSVARPQWFFYACWRGFLLGQLTFENSLVQPLNLGIKKGQELNPGLFIKTLSKRLIARKC